MYEPSQKTRTLNPKALFGVELFIKTTKKNNNFWDGNKTRRK